MSDDGERVWLITGAGRGLGRAFAEAALRAGDRVVATARTPGDLDDVVEHHGHAIRVLQLDVRDRHAVMSAVASAFDCFGYVDVVVNNAGYGLVGAVEEVTEDDVRQIIDTDFLGALWVTQAVLPRLRGRGSGHIVQISTVGGVGTMPAFGMYNAAKWALEAFSEALAAEVREFGIRVTIAELGGFDTDWAGRSMRFAEPLDAYDRLRTAVFGSPTVPWPLDADDAAGGSDEPGPELAAAALLAHVDAPDGPLRLLVGDDAVAHVGAALQLRRDDYERDERFVWP
jgi:NAD(P)-dependent dehydrogenase (short-subunit alcohol dehydrogenase family)